MEDMRARLDELAYHRGAEEMASGLFELVDDCERALKALVELDDPDSVRKGLLSMRSQLLNHFARLGYQSVDPVGDNFDPHLHQAVEVEVGPGRDGVVVKVHRRGWLHGQKLIQPALVTVRQGELSDDADVPARRRRRPLKSMQRVDAGETL